MWRATLCTVLVTISLACLCAPATAQTVVRNPGAEAYAAQRVKDTGNELLVKPNAPHLHVNMAEAYFLRGSRSDASRVYRHYNRAIQISPSYKKRAEKFFRVAQPGLRMDALSAEETVLDEQVKTTLPSHQALAMKDRKDCEAPNCEDPESIIQTGLGQRVMRRSLRKKLTTFKEAKEEISRMFGWKQHGNGDDKAEWAERIKAIKARRRPTGWEAAYNGALFNAVSAFNMQRGNWRRPTNDTSLGDAQGEAEKVPEPLDTKNKAVVDFTKGKIEKAIDGLIDTVAAAEVRKNMVKPKKEIPVVKDERQPRLAEKKAAPSPQRTAPEVNREVGQKALETLEALRNPEVPPEKVDRKVSETAATGVVGEPLLIDVNRNGCADIHGSLLPDGVLSKGTTVRFDLDGDGHAERVEWVLPGEDGLLAVDLDGDGVASAGGELFGTAYGDPDGFHRLAVFDLDGDGWIRGREAATLSVWIDDGDGQCRPAEMHSLKSLGIEALSCRPEAGVAPVKTKSGTLQCWEWLPDVRP